MNMQTITVDAESLHQAVPIQPFVHATLFALSVMAGQAPMDTDDLEGAVDPRVPKSHPINRALLTLQASLAELGQPIELRLAAVQRFLALMNSDVSAPELHHLVARNEAGQVVGLSATLIAGAACASVGGASAHTVEFDVRVLARAAGDHGGEISGCVQGH